MTERLSGRDNHVAIWTRIPSKAPEVDSMKGYMMREDNAYALLCLSDITSTHVRERQMMCEKTCSS